MKCSEEEGSILSTFLAATYMIIFKGKKFK